MARYLLNRLGLLVPTVLGISVLVFALMRMLPGNVIDTMLGPELIKSFSPEQRATLLRMFGLDQPVYIQYFRWLGGVAHGDLGVSLRTSTPVTEQLTHSVPVTAELALLAVIFSTVIAVPLGVFAAIGHNSVVNFVSNLLGLVGLSFPNFWLATLLLLITSRYLHWQPSPNWVSFWHNPLVNLEQMLLPALSLSLALMAVVMRMTRSAMLEVMGQDYIRTARSKGQRERIVVMRHALKNAAIPVLTVIGLQLGGLLGGTVIIEQIFGIPGVGWLTLNGIYQRDYPVVQGAVLFVAIVFVLVNLLVDMTYAFVDPRIRYG